MNARPQTQNPNPNHTTSAMVVVMVEGPIESPPQPQRKKGVEEKREPSHAHQNYGGKRGTCDAHAADEGLVGLLLPPVVPLHADLHNLEEIKPQNTIVRGA